MAGRLVLLATSPRVAPGLLSWRAWEVLRGGSEGGVLVGSGDHPQLPHLREAGVTPRVVPDASDEDRARSLLERARSGPVVWLAGADGDPGLVGALGELVAAEPEGMPEVEVLHGSYDLPGARLLDLVSTMDELRRQCPWDRRQTHASLAPYLLEEAYETVEVIEAGEARALREELGDVLLQVAFHARVAEERTDETRFTIDDVAAGIVDKLVRRHPHVFGRVRVDGAEEVIANWDAIKQAERAERGQASVTEGVPLAQPALSLAYALQRRAVRAGLPGDLVEPADGGIGDRLFALVARAHAQGVDPETALRGVARAFRERFVAVETAAREEGVELSSLSPQEWRERWTAASSP